MDELKSTSTADNSRVPSAAHASSAAPPPDHRPLFERHRTAIAFGLGISAAMLAGLVSWRATRLAERRHLFGSRWQVERPVIAIAEQEILADMRAAQGEPGWPSELHVPPPHGQASGSARAASADAGGTVRRATRRRAEGQRPKGGAPLEASTSDPYAALFGAAEQFQAGNALSVSSPAKVAADGRKGSAEGTLLPARLASEVASAPSGGPVIATMQRAVRVRGVLWPRGTELHGTCTGSGSSDTRLFVTFDLARLPSGRTERLRGMAVDLAGRHGVRGKKIITRASVGSVGLAAASSAARTLGRALAGSVGAVVGSGIEGASESSQSKVRRLDSDEYVVIAARGTPMQVYVTDRSEGEGGG